MSRASPAVRWASCARPRSSLPCAFSKASLLREGLQSISLSYAQGTNDDEDVGAVLALRRLAVDFLGESFPHVLYTFMGLFPTSLRAARRMISDTENRNAARGRLDTDGTVHAASTYKEEESGTRRSVFWPCFHITATDFRASYGRVRVGSQQITWCSTPVKRQASRMRSAVNPCGMIG